MADCGVQGVPKLMLAHWWVGLGLYPPDSQHDPKCPEMFSASLVGGTRAQGFPELFPDHWWAELNPRVSAGRCLGIPGLVVVHCCVGWHHESSGWTKLGPGVAVSSVVLKQLACWWVELCPCLASCLAWVLVPSQWHWCQKVTGWARSLC